MRFAATCFFLWVTITIPAAAEEHQAQQRGREIVEQAFRQHFNYRDVSARFKMILESPEQTATREGVAKALILDDGRSVSLVTMTRPRDIIGYALLTHSWNDRPDDQWLYQRKTRKVVRLNATNRGQPFLGSDFSFQDLGSPGLGKFDYRYLGEEQLDGRNCLVVERVPRLEKTGYSRQVVYYLQERLHPLRIIYYDESGKRVKTQDFLDYRLIDGQHWRALENHMSHHARNTSTRLLWSDIRFDTGLSENEFQISTLTRRR